MDNPLYMPKGWRAGLVRLQPTVAHEEAGVTYVKGFNGAGGGGGGGALLPVNSVLVTSGDSIVAGYLGGTPPQDKAFTSAGYVYYGLQNVDHRLRVPHNGNLAVSGYNQTQILASYGTAGATLNALNPKVVLNNGGTNELSSQTLANMLATEAQIRALVLATPTEAKYVRVGITPRFAPNDLSVGDEQKRVDFNAALAAAAAANPSRIVYVDPDVLGLAAGDFADGLHPNATGARKIGVPLGVAFDSLLAAGNITTAPAIETYTLNPTFTGGTTTATSWTLSQTSGAAVNGITATASKDGSARQRLLISGTPSGSSQSLSLDQYTNVGAVGKTPAAGSIFELVAEFEVVGVPTGINSINLLYGTSTSGFANLARGQRMLPNYVEALTEVAAGVYRTRCPVVLMGSGAPNYIDGRVIVTLINGASVSLDLRLSFLEFRRIA